MILDSHLYLPSVHAYDHPDDMYVNNERSNLLLNAKKNHSLRKIRMPEVGKHLKRLIYVNKKRASPNDLVFYAI